MKKIISLCLILLLTLSLGACGKKEEETEAEEDDTLRVALIINQLGDNSFNDSCNAGLLEAVEDFGIEYDCRQVGDDGIINSMREAAQNGYDIVCCAYDSDRRAFLDSESMEYPDTIFFIYDCSDTSYVPNDNVCAAVFSANESDFVCGAIAAKQSTTKVTGWIGGQEMMVLYDFLVGWVEGVTYADSTATTAYAWIGGDNPWYDPAKAKELTHSLYNIYGTDVVHGVAGQSGDGVVEALYELRQQGVDNVWDIGVDSDLYLTFANSGKEDKAEVVLTSALKKPAKPIYDIIKTIVEGGTPELGCKTYGIAEGAAGCADNDYYRSAACAEALAIADQITADVLSGAIKVDSAYGMSIEELEALFMSTTVNYVVPNV